MNEDQATACPLLSLPIYTESSFKDILYETETQRTIAQSTTYQWGLY